MNATCSEPNELSGRNTEALLEEARAIAREVVGSCGYGKTLVVGPTAPYLVKVLVEKGVDAYGLTTEECGTTHLSARIKRHSVSGIRWEADSIDNVVILGLLDGLEVFEIDNIVSDLEKLGLKALFVRVAPDAIEGNSFAIKVRSREWWEARFFEAGFRKHPLYYHIVNYHGLEHETENRTISILLEPVPQAALVRYPLTSLKEERDLHMDMTREPGRRSDAHIVRYQWASAYVRPGDTVLDAACGLGYGSYLIQKCTKARRTIGIDGSDYAINYAQANYAAVMPGLEFRVGFLPEALRQIGDATVDLVISYETLEHVEENESLLVEFRRILTPAGRIIVSVPNDWTDEDTGKDPNPFHLHVYDLEKFRKQISRNFILEKLVAQSASRHKSGRGRRTWVKATRSLVGVPTDVNEQESPDAEWWIAVGMRDPIDGEAIPYHETQFPVFEHSAWNVTSFARDYKNPWLIRGMVHIWNRLQDDKALQDLARSVMRRSPISSPDFGAALTVLGYRMLASENSTEADILAFEGDVCRYVGGAHGTPHNWRWVVSLWFLLGKIWSSVGQYSKAEAALTKCIEVDPLKFSPLLANRSVEARLMLGLLCVRDRKEEAIEHWKAGIEMAQRAVTADWTSSLGDVATPAEFALPELASILEYASSCAYALVNIADFGTRPLWWYEWQRSNIFQRELRAEEFSMERRYYTQQIEAYKRESEELRASLAQCEHELNNLTLRHRKITDESGAEPAATIQPTSQKGKKTFLLKLKRSIRKRIDFVRDWLWGRVSS